MKRREPIYEENSGRKKNTYNNATKSYAINVTGSPDQPGNTTILLALEELNETIF